MVQHFLKYLLVFIIEDINQTLRHFKPPLQGKHLSCTMFEFPKLSMCIKFNSLLLREVTTFWKLDKHTSITLVNGFVPDIFKRVGYTF